MATNVTPQSATAQKNTAQPRQSWWASLVILCAVLGALLGLSFKTRDLIRRQDVPADNFPQLTEEYRILKRKDDDDTRLIMSLQKQKTALENGTSSNTKQVQALLSDLKQTKFLAGLTDAVGPGVLVTLNDSKKTVPPQMQAAVPINIIHDTDINQIINELKAAGAEAISVNNQRLVATSPIRCAGPTVFVNNTAQTPPYVIRAIGDATTLQAALNLPGGVADQMRAFDPAMIKVQTSKHMIVPASPGPPPPKYAKPAATSIAEGQTSVAATH
ncbi:MAG: DUF881 domain-containing protein [Armatimonadetes bacterium]|nr:DUF881 domain-containing protein [Armatimonadota bacterium]